MIFSTHLSQYRRFVLQASLIFLLNVASVNSSPNTTMHDSDTKGTISYPDVAITDLQYMRDALILAHPAALDESDVHFFRWMRNGYGEAMKLARRATTKADVLAVDRFFTNGLRDAHVAVFAHDLVVPPPLWAGWTMDYDGESFYVGYRARTWPSELPPVGGKVVACDGESVKTLLAKNFAPFIDNRQFLEASWVAVAKFATLETQLVPRMPLYRIKNCDILHDGRLRNYSLSWNVDTNQHVSAFVRRDSFSVERLRSGIVWATLPAFQLNKAQVSEFERVIQELSAINSSSGIVLDVRGNSGGDSLLAEKLARWLYGNVPVADAHRRMTDNTFAEWRVSSIAIDELTARLDALDGAGRRGDPTYLATQELLSLMTQAIHSKAPWIRQPNVPDATDAPDSTGFVGPLAILTDSSCASACLNFVELFRNLPGAVHFGRPTDADTIYLDITEVNLPSGFRFRFPLKVWRNRHRGSNEPLVPQVLYKGPMTDNLRVKHWVEENLRNGIASGQ